MLPCRVTIPAATYAQAMRDLHKLLGGPAPAHSRGFSYPTPSVTDVASYVFGPPEATATSGGGPRDTVAVLSTAAYDAWLRGIRRVDREQPSSQLRLIAVPAPPPDAAAFSALMSQRWLRGLTDLEAMTFGVAMFAFSDGEFTRFVRGFLHDDGTASVVVPELRQSTMHVQISANAVQFTGVWNAYNDCTSTDGGEFLCYDLPSVMNASPQVAPTIGGTKVMVFGTALTNAAVGQQTFVRFRSVDVSPPLSAVVPGTCCAGGFIECVTPPFGGPFRGKIDVSLNGQQYSDSAGNFQVYSLPVLLGAMPKMVPLDAAARLCVEFSFVPELAAGSVRARAVYSVHDTVAHYDDIVASEGDAPAVEGALQPQSFVREDVVCEVQPPASLKLVLPAPGIRDMPRFLSRIACAVARNIGLEVAFDGQNFVHAGNLGARVNLYSWPVVSTLSPVVGMGAGGVTLTITGQGFVRSPELQVRFRGKCGGVGACSVEHVGDHEEIVPAQYVNTTTLTCVCPAWPLGGMFSSTIAVDASVYGGLFPMAESGAATTASIMLCSGIVLSECEPRCGPLRGGTRVHLYGCGFPQVKSLVVRLEVDSVVEVRPAVADPAAVLLLAASTSWRATAAAAAAGDRTFRGRKESAAGASGTRRGALTTAVPGLLLGDDAEPTTAVTTEIFCGEDVVWKSDSAVTFSTPRFSRVSSSVRVRLSINGIEYTATFAKFEVFEAPSLDCVRPYAVPSCGGIQISLLCREPMSLSAPAEQAPGASVTGKPAAVPETLNATAPQGPTSPRSRGSRTMSLAAVAKILAAAKVPAHVARAVPFPDTGCIVVRFGDGPDARIVRAIVKSSTEISVTLPRLARAGHGRHGLHDERVRLNLSFNGGHDFEPICDAPHVPQTVDPVFDKQVGASTPAGERKPRYGDEISVYPAPVLASLDVSSGPDGGGTVIHAVGVHMRGPQCRGADECRPLVRFGDGAGGPVIPLLGDIGVVSSGGKVDLVFTAPPNVTAVAAAGVHVHAAGGAGRGRVGSISSHAGVATAVATGVRAGERKGGGVTELLAQLTLDKAAREHAAAVVLVLPNAVQSAVRVPLYLSVDGGVTWVPTPHRFVYFPNNTRVTGACCRSPSAVVSFACVCFRARDPVAGVQAFHPMPGL